MRWSDVKKYGLGPAQVNMVVNDVIKDINSSNKIQIFVTLNYF